MADQTIDETLSNQNVNPDDLSEDDRQELRRNMGNEEELL